MKKRMIAGLMAVLMTMSLAACGSSAGSSDASGTGSAATGDNSAAQAASGDKVTLSLCWWGNQTRNDVTKKAVDLYMEQNPNVEIKVEFTDWSGYWDKLSAMAAGGNLPDIIQMDYSYLQQYQQSGQLADLSQFIDTSKIADSVIDSGSIDGTCYALSLGSNAPMMVYDKEIVEQAGVELPEQLTIEELYDIGQTIYEKTGVKTYYDGGINMMQIIARTQGSHLFDELAAGTKTASETHFANVDKFNKAESAISPDLLAEKNPDVVETKPIIDGTTWNDFSYSNQYISIANTAGRDLGITMYPTTSDATTQPMFLKPSQFFSIAETSQNKEEAAKFLDWFTNSIECNNILMAERGIPVNSDVAEAIKPNVDENSQKVFDYIAEVSKIATPIDDPDPSGKGEIEAQAKTIVENLRYGDTDAAGAAEEFVTTSQKILSETAK
jgi:putative extracellular solute-binding domain protein